MEVHVVNIIVHLQRVCVYNPPLADAHGEGGMGETLTRIFHCCGRN